MEIGPEGKEIEVKELIADC